MRKSYGQRFWHNLICLARRKLYGSEFNGSLHFLGINVSILHWCRGIITIYHEKKTMKQQAIDGRRANGTLRHYQKAEAFSSEKIFFCTAQNSEKKYLNSIGCRRCEHNPFSIIIIVTLTKFSPESLRVSFTQIMHNLLFLPRISTTHNQKALLHNMRMIFVEICLSSHQRIADNDEKGT